MQRNLGYAAKTVRVLNAHVAGTTSVNADAVVDRLGFESVRFTVCFGTLSATQVTEIKVQGSNTNNGSDWTDLASTHTGPMADGDSNKFLQLDLFRPQYRYLQLVVVRGTANAVIDAGIADLYLASAEPVTVDSSCSALNVQPYAAAGTA